VNIFSFQNTVPSPDDVVAVINLLNQMTALLALELAALSEESDLPSLGSSNQYDSLLGSEPSSLGINPCLDILLTENILSHVLAASRMPISQGNLLKGFDKKIVRRQGIIRLYLFSECKPYRTT
jgi:hypothetical protein